MDIIAQGDNKVSFRHRNGMQVDVRFLPPESFGAAMQYFTGSKAHNVALRQRALKMGFTLNEYALATLEGEKPVARKTEEEIYAKLKLDFIPPELRENLGEIDAAAAHTLPKLIEQSDIRGDVHMHTVETDGRNTIEEMAEAAQKRGYEYMAITDHSKNLAFANGLTDERALAHIEQIRAVEKKMKGIRIFAGIEVFDAACVPGDGFIHRVVENFGSQMMQRAFVGAADIHARPAANGFKALKNLDVLGRVIHSASFFVAIKEIGFGSGTGHRCTLRVGDRARI